MDSDSEMFSSGDEEQNMMMIDKISPTLSSPYPLNAKLAYFLPPLRVLRISLNIKVQLQRILEEKTVKKIHKVFEQFGFV